MKRFFMCLMTLLMVFSFAACNQNPSSEATNPASPGGQTETMPTAQPKSSTPVTPQPLESSVPPESPQDSAKASRILVAYFSRSGNTESLAMEIQRQTDGELFEIIPEEPYSEDYNETVERHRKEQAEDARPPISNTVEAMDSYDIVFVGYPIWSSDLPYVVRTFLEQYDFSGKTIIPFCTNGGSRFGNSISTLERLCPNVEIADGFEISGSQADDCAEEVSNWLESLDLTE